MENGYEEGCRRGANFNAQLARWAFLSCSSTSISSTAKTLINSTADKLTISIKGSCSITIQKTPSLKLHPDYQGLGDSLLSSIVKAEMRR